MACLLLAYRRERPVDRPDIFIVAAEPSGDQLGAGLAHALNRKNPNLKLSAIGGSALKETGLESRMDIDGLAILGFVEGLKAYGFVLKKVREATEIIMKTNPRSVVLIDSWGFMVRIAKALKARGYTGHIIKYVAPQVWAMRSGRGKILARYVDHLLSTQPMDAPFFEAAGLPQTFVGNPVLDTDYSAGDRLAFLSRHNLKSTAMTVGFFFGSRPSEIERVGPALILAHDRLSAEYPDLQALCVIADPVRHLVEPQLEGRDVHLIDQDELIDAMSVMDGAMACSGTITTQLAAAGVPTSVLYRLSPLTYFVASRLFKPPFFSLVNISAAASDPDLEDPLMPEFVQDDIMTDAPSQALIEIIGNPGMAEAVREALKHETRRMGAGSGSASDRAADAIMSILA